MRLRFNTTIGLLFALAVPAVAAPLPPQTKPPTGPAPQLVVVVSVDLAQGLWTSEETVQIVVPVQEARVVVRDGRKVQEVVTRYRPEYRTEHRSRTLVGLKRYTADGKPLTEEALAKRLTPGSVVLVANSGGIPDEAYLKLVKPDTVVLVPPTAEPAPNAPVPMAPRAVIPGPKQQ